MLKIVPSVLNQAAFRKLFCDDFALSISKVFFSLAEFSQLLQLFHGYLGMAPEENNASLLHLPVSAIPVRDGWRAPFVA